MTRQGDTLYGWLHSPGHGTYYLDRVPGHDSAVRLRHVNDIPRVPSKRESCGVHHNTLNDTQMAEYDKARPRARRAGPASANHKVCTVFLDGDLRWLAHHGGVGTAQEKQSRAIARMISIINEVDGYVPPKKRISQVTVPWPEPPSASASMTDSLPWHGN